jgi:Ca-activated chloride channel family protein
MQLLGLSLVQLSLVLALAASITLCLYLLKQRRRRVAVSFLPLWEGLLLDRQASRLFARLRHLLSLLLALVIVALMSFALADPQKRAEASAARHMLVVIDVGVTMQARDVAPTRLAAALAQARRLVRSAGPGLRMQVAQMDASTTPLCSWSTDPRELLRALTQVRSSDLPTDPQRAYRFALDVLRGRSNPELAMISDAAIAPDAEVVDALGQAGARISFIPVGRRADDVGISAFAVRRYPLDKNRSELLLELYSAASHPETVELTLLGDGAPIDVQRVTLAPYASLHRIYDDVTGVSRTLEARIKVAGDHNDLRANDRAYALLPEKRRVRVLCVSDGNRYLEAALLLDEYLDADLLSPAKYTAATGYDAVIFDRFVPPRAPARPALYLDPTGEGPGQPLAIAGRIARPFFDKLQEKHPVLRFTALRDANVASALLVRPAPGDEVLAADARGPLIIAGKRAGGPFVALTFDLRESDLPLRVAWPLLLLNTIDWLAGGAPEAGAEGVVGRSERLTLPDGVTRAQVRGPDGRAREATIEGHDLPLTPTRAGFYRIAWNGGERWFAANLSPATRRDLTPQPQLKIKSALAPRPKVASASFERPPWVFLLVLALVLLLAEWLTFHRRWTV